MALLVAKCVAIGSANRLLQMNWRDGSDVRKQMCSERLYMTDIDIEAILMNQISDFYLEINVYHKLSKSSMISSIDNSLQNRGFHYISLRKQFCDSVTESGITAFYMAHF